MPDINTRIRAVARIAMIYLGALSAGIIALWLQFPLPWMLGALIFASALRLLEKRVDAPVLTRQMGQLLVGCSIGAAFTSDTLAIMSPLLIPILGATILTLAICLGMALILVWVAKTDFVSACLSTLPLGPVESATLADRYNLASGPIVFSQTLRIIFIIVFIPPIIVLIDGTAKNASEALSSVPWSLPGTSLLLIVGLTGAIIANVLKLGNPYFLGSMAGAACAAVFDLPIAALPYPMLIVAQIFLGVFLGAAFSRTLFRRAGSFITSAAVASLALIVLCALVGIAIAMLVDLPWQVMVLATAPGSVTEMALTAKVLQQGLSVVTAFHLTRVMIILLLAGPLIRLAAYISSWKPPR